MLFRSITFKFIRVQNSLDILSLSVSSQNSAFGIRLDISSILTHVFCNVRGSSSFRRIVDTFYFFDLVNSYIRTIICSFDYFIGGRVRELEAFLI